VKSVFGDVVLVSLLGGGYFCFVLFLFLTLFCGLIQEFFCFSFSEQNIIDVIRPTQHTKHLENKSFLAHVKKTTKNIVAFLYTKHHNHLEKQAFANQRKNCPHVSSSNLHKTFVKTKNIFFIF